MPRYKIEIGDSNTGSIGAVFYVEAATPEDAHTVLFDEMGDAFPADGYRPFGKSGDQFAVYFNFNNTDDIVIEEDEHESALTVIRDAGFELVHQFGEFQDYEKSVREPESDGLQPVGRITYIDTDNTIYGTVTYATVDRVIDFDTRPATVENAQDLVREVEGK
jgi:hypothetical protein